MEFTWLSILPPIIAIALALLTKEVISSLLIGILSGVLIYSHGNIIVAVESMFSIMGGVLGGNAFIIIFLCLLGVLVAVVTKAGGSAAYGEWATRKIRSKSGALLSTSALGALIFVDDYFNCLTVGSVMRPVTDKYRVSREKLAYIIDATAAPICIIAPVSSWAVSVAATIEESGIPDGFGAFMRTIPFNFYAILTILALVFFSLCKRDFGPMRKFEEKAEKNGILPEDTASGSLLTSENTNSHGRVYDLLIPIISLIVISILAMLYTGGLFAGEGKTILQAFGDTDANTSLVWGGFAALIVAFLLYVPRKLISFKTFMESVNDGVRNMVPAIIILTLAWTISGVCGSDYLGTGAYVGSLVANSSMPMQLLPAIIFLIACGLAFATGTAWGTFGILVPIVVSIGASIPSFTSSLLTIVIAATLAGSVFGDHCSPISDTTILASAGADCRHINHVSSQLPYACAVAGCCFVAYILAGFIQNVWLCMAIAIALLAVALFVVYTLTGKGEKAASKRA
ncbi:MAG: Na+/H+ antiporter NhaC family protein [Clostridiaceae bacterium]|nr:Na+/H+ antiporter NhaC family protein [Clostridiaceae bacterium]